MPNMPAANNLKIANYSSLQRFVDENTTGTTQTGKQVSLVFNDVTSAAAANTTGHGTTPTVATPRLPASGTAQANNTGSDVNVYIYGGTVSAVKVNGQQVGSGAGSYYVSAGSTIKVTYSAAPTWVWQAENGVAPATYIEAVVGGVLVKIPVITA